MIPLHPFFPDIGLFIDVPRQHHLFDGGKRLLVDIDSRISLVLPVSLSTTSVFDDYHIRDPNFLFASGLMQ